MKRERDTAIGLNQIYDRNRELVGVTSSPTCLCLLYLVDSRPGISLEDLDREFTFKIGTAKTWMQRLLDVGLIERDDSSGHHLSKIGVARADLAETTSHLLDLVNSRPGITVEDIAGEHTFRVGTAETWMKALLDAGLFELEGASYHLSKAGEKQIAFEKTSSDKPAE